MIIRSLFARLGFKVDRSKADEFSNIIGNIKRDLVVFSIAWGAATASLGLFLREAGKMEQVEVAFETMLGSVDRAKNLLTDLYDFVRITPFRIPEVFSVTRSLLGMGIESNKMIVTLRHLGNVASGLNVPLQQIALSFGKTAAATYLTGYELQNLRRAGVPLVRVLAQMLNITREQIQHMVRTRQITFSMVEEAFRRMSEKGGTFHRLMERQSQTFLGIISNIKDALQIIAIYVGKALLPDARRIANQFLLILEAYKQPIIQRSFIFLRTISKYTVFIVKQLTSITRSVFQIIESLGGLERIMRIVLIVISAFLALKLLYVIGRITQSIYGLVKALITAQFVGSAAVIALGAAVVLFFLIIEDMYKWLTGGKGQSLIQYFDDKLFGGNIRKKVLSFLDILKEFKKLISEGFFEKQIGKITDKFSGLKQSLEALKKILINIKNVFVGLALITAGFLSGDVGMIAEGKKQLGEAIKGFKRSSTGGTASPITRPELFRAIVPEERLGVMPRPFLAPEPEKGIQLDDETIKKLTEADIIEERKSILQGLKENISRLGDIYKWIATKPGELSYDVLYNITREQLNRPPVNINIQQELSFSGVMTEDAMAIIKDKTKNAADEAIKESNKRLFRETYEETRALEQ